MRNGAASGSNGTATALDKPVVLTLSRYYVPGFRAGGPIRSISNLVAKLGDEYQFRIITLGRDAFESEPYPGVQIGAWVNVGKASVFYLGSSAAAPTVIKLIRDTPHDVLYLNSMFDPVFSAGPLLARSVLRAREQPPVVLAPRGEFSNGALAIKARKKAAYLAATKLLRGHGDVAWQASTVHEAADIQRVMRPAEERVFIAPDLSQQVCRRPVRVRDHQQDPLRVCFLSRISPMKNLDYAFRVLREVNASVVFSIYGLDEGGEYSRRCRELAEELPPNIKATFYPPVPHNEVGEVFAAQDLFFVPSRGENFGHVFIEALSAGLPVLTSDRTPWRNLENFGVGWSLGLNDPSRFVEAIEIAANWSRDARIAIGERCAKFAVTHLDDSEAVEANRRLFMTVLGSVS